MPTVLAESPPASVMAGTHLCPHNFAPLPLAELSPDFPCHFPFLKGVFLLAFSPLASPESLGFSPTKNAPTAKRQPGRVFVCFCMPMCAGFPDSSGGNLQEHTTVSVIFKPDGCDASFPAIDDGGGDFVLYLPADDAAQIPRAPFAAVGLAGQTGGRFVAPGKGNPLIFQGLNQFAKPSGRRCGHNPPG